MTVNGDMDHRDYREQWKREVRVGKVNIEGIEFPVNDKSRG